MKKPLFLLAIVLSFGQMIAQNSSIWQKTSDTNLAKLTRVNPHQNTEGELYYTLDLNTFRQSLVNATDKFSGQQGVVVSFPNLTGEIESFQVWENSNFTPDLQAKFPEIRAYVGKGITDKGATINFSTSPYGIETIVFRSNGSDEFMEGYDKSSTAYVLFGDANRNGRSGFTCSTIDVPMPIDTSAIADKTQSSAGSYKTMRLALSCTAEYANYFGATSSANQALVETAMNNTMTRVNGVMEKDLAVHLNMIDNSNVIYYNASTDPYDPSSTGAGGTWNAQLMNTLHAASYNADGTGDSAFDIGHLVGKDGGGGNAGCIGCVCSNTLSTGGNATNSYKGCGFTSPGIDGITGLQGPPSGDTFDIDYVIHEMGHQLGANHTFTDSYEGTVAQVEPGSASTIMGYAGITSYDVQKHSDAIYAYVNIKQIQTNLGTKTCPVSTVMTNNTPVVNAGLDYTIPVGTAFMLTGTATDADASDVLTYLWEQNDKGTSTTVNASSEVLQTKTAGPNFRTFKPSTNLFRYFPQMAKILSGTIAVTTAGLTNWESVSSVARTLNFTFTARDNHPGGGQTAEDASIITVNATGGPFTVSSQSTTGISYAGLSTQTVTWNVANTTASPFNTANVDILLSTNVSTALETSSATGICVSPNPTTWTTIASSVPNTGSYAVTLPNVTASTATCRFMVKAVGNVFLAVNSKNFTLTPALATDSFELDNFALYPNPNSGNFTIQFNSTSSNDINVSVYDLRGRSIFEKQYANTGLFNQNLQLNNLQAGIYLVTVKDGDKKVVKKIVIQ